MNLEGGTRWLLGNIEVVEHDGIRSTMVTVRDITTRTQMERENQYQQANLQYMARYNAMGDMAMTIAHELGQPPLAAAGNYLKGAVGPPGRGSGSPPRRACGTGWTRPSANWVGPATSWPA